MITEAYNDYDQHGEYLVTVFTEKPSVKELIETLGLSQDYAEHVEKGGGRLGTENNWWFLTELQEGQYYEHKNK